MPVPKKKSTTTRRDKRRTNQKLSAPALSTCEHCGSKKMPHVVCPVCGYVHIGDSAPEKCPQCGVPGSKFKEEAVSAGVEQILIITNRGKDSIENYFDYAPDLEERLRADGKEKEGSVQSP